MDKCIQNFHFGRYSVGYTVGNLVLGRRASWAVKRDFQTYIWWYTSTNENFEYGYPHSNAFLQFHLKLMHCKLQKSSLHPSIYGVTNDVQLFRTVYHRIYCRKFLTLPNQMSRYKIKCIRMPFMQQVHGSPATAKTMSAKASFHAPYFEILLLACLHIPRGAQWLIWGLDCGSKGR